MEKLIELCKELGINLDFLAVFFLFFFVEIRKYIFIPARKLLMALDKAIEDNEFSNKGIEGHLEKLVNVLSKKTE